jgi:hypothetical protein
LLAASEYGGARGVLAGPASDRIADGDDGDFHGGIFSQKRKERKGLSQRRRGEDAKDAEKRKKNTEIERDDEQKLR